MQRQFEYLKRKTLDMSQRNPQINFRDSVSSTIFVLNEMESIYDLLIKKRKPLEVNINKFIDLDRYNHGNLQTNRNGADTRGILNRLNSKTKLAVNELGFHPLYMTFGMLTWFDNLSNKEVKSPLLMVPVKIIKKGLQKFHLSYTLGEIELNPTLIYRLSLDDINIETFDFFEHNVFSVKTYLDKIASYDELSKNKMKVSYEVYLGLFASTSLYMHQDIEEVENDLVNHEIIGKLYGAPDPNLDDDPDFLKLSDVDKMVNYNKTYQILDADASQQTAILAAKNGASFVIQGPPGTGKSQTITNIISEMLAANKKVLLVAEKKAALDVVYQKLKMNGLSPYVLELHSYKANKEDMLKDLISSVEKQDFVYDEFSYGELEKLKGYLISYEEKTHHKFEQINLSLYDLYGILKEYEDLPILNYQFNSVYQIKDSEIKKIVEDIEKYLRFKNAIGDKSAVENLGKLKDGLAKQPSFIKQYQKRCVSFSEVYKEIQELLIDLPLVLENISSLEKTSQIFKIANKANVRVDYDDYLGAYKAALRLIELDSILRKYKLVNAKASFSAKEIDRYQALYKDKKRQEEALSLFRKLNSIFQKPIKCKRKLIKVLNKIFPYILERNKALDVLSGNTKPYSKIKNELSWVNEIAKIEPNYYPKYIDFLQSHNENEIKSLSKQIDTSLNEIRDVISFLEKSYVGISFSEMSLKELDLFLVSTAYSFENFDAKEILEEVTRNLKANKLLDLAFEVEKHPDNFKEIIYKKYYLQWVDYIYFSNNNFKEYNLRVLNTEIDKFVSLDKDNIKTASLRIKKILNKVYPKHNDPYMQTLRDEMVKKKGQKTIRQLFDEMYKIILQIKPVVLMSPLSVSTFLPAISGLFDCVLFDEASQIVPEHAITSIYRGKQVIVAGDHEQLPPTSFFKQLLDEEDEDEDLTDYESILDIARGHLPSKKLRWHYRSWNEDLIYYSNKHIYKNLISFPKTDFKKGIIFHHVTDGVYNNQVNQAEAEYVANLVIEHARKTPKLSLGVVAFSIKQANAIERAVDKKRANHPELDKFFDDELDNAFFVKNLENVQGDERDVMVLSVCYGKDSNGKIIYRFGPINQQMGYRRLNVAITRAKSHLHLVSSIKASDLNPPNQNKGLSFLKGYLEFAEKGNSTYDFVGVKHKSKAIEKDIYNQLTDLGYQVEYNIHPFIPIAIKDKDQYVLAIQTDGINYKNIPTIRERHRLNLEVLRNKGWNIKFIYSSDWFNNSDKIINEIKELIGEPKKKPIKQITDEVKQDALPKDIVKDENIKEDKQKLEQPTKQKIVLEDDEVEYPIYEELTPAMCERTDDETIIEYKNRFLMEVIKKEAPIYDEVLFRRIAAIDNETLVTSQERKRIVEKLIELEIDKTIIYDNHFVYLPKQKYKIRIPKTKIGARKLEEISPAELKKAFEMYKISENSDSKMEMVTNFMMLYKISMTKQEELLKILDSDE